MQIFYKQIDLQDCNMKGTEMNSTFFRSYRVTWSYYALNYTNVNQEELQSYASVKAL